MYSRPSVYFKLNITTLYNHTLKYNKAMSPVLITHQNLGWTPSSKVNKICLPHCALTTINRKQFKLIYYWLNSTYIGILFTRRRKTCCTNTHRHLKQVPVSIHHVTDSIEFSTSSPHIFLPWTRTKCSSMKTFRYLDLQGFQSGPVPGTFTRLRSCIVPAEITEPPKISSGQNHKYDGR